MAFDGAVVSALADELKKKLSGGRISKIAQTESDELILTVNREKNRYRLLLSANPSLPLVYLTEKNKPSPANPPAFCMLLRKHIGGGRIVDVRQPGLERAIFIIIEHTDELADKRLLKLSTEIMGKHSNIILVDENEKIIDSIKRVSSFTSSVRCVLPGRDYFIPDTLGRANPFEIDRDKFCGQILSGSGSVSKTLCSSFTGISPALANSICHSGGADGDRCAGALEESEKAALFLAFSRTAKDIREKNFVNKIYFEENGDPVAFSAVELSAFSDCDFKSYESTSEMLETYYSKRNSISRMRAKSSQLRRHVSLALERDIRKLELQQKQLKDTEKREKYRIYGELITAYGYSVPQGEKSFKALNYYDNTEITVPLDTSIPVMDNAKKYFAKYAKQKRTAAALETIIKDTADSVSYLESVLLAIDIAENEDDLAAIRRELEEGRYIKKSSKGKERRHASTPLHFRSSDGFDIYVGKNNTQNEELTFKRASGNDLWLHAKNIPGSHVIIKTDGRDVTDEALDLAARLAAYYSKGRQQTKVEVDYTPRKNLKKVPGGAPGFVIYHTNRSMPAKPDISDANEILS